MPSAIAIDCEMVGTGTNGCNSKVARVSLVDEDGKCVLDEFIKPSRKVTDYRTFVSGISEVDLVHARPVEEVKLRVAKLIKKKILVGHTVAEDLQAMMLSHPDIRLRDIAQHPDYRTSAGQPMSLSRLAETYLSRTIQRGSHSSVEDARAAMDVYKRVKHRWVH